MSTTASYPPHAHNEPREDEDVVALMPTRVGARILLCAVVCIGLSVLLLTVTGLWVKSLLAR